MTPDQIIEVLQGVKAGRKWGYRQPSNSALVEYGDQCVLSLLRVIFTAYQVELMPLPDEITIPARVIPAPLREAPELSRIYFLANPLTAEAYRREVWRDDDIDRRALARGLAFASSEDAEKAGKAMCPYA